MPELPEVETVRRGLLEALPGRRIEAVQAVEPFMLREVSPEELVRGVTGRRVEDVRRHGKFLMLVLTGDLYLSLHLGMTGQVTLRAPDDLPSHTRFCFGLSARRVPEGDGDPVAAGSRADRSPSDGGGLTEALIFRDVRKFGRVELTLGSPPDRVLAMGPDALEGSWTSAGLTEILEGRRAPLKAFLLDQRRLAGIGNIYADEILHAARLAPDRSAGSLSGDEVTELAAQIRSRLAEGVRLRGCSISDFVDAQGRPGGFQQVLQAYGRHGERCRRCGSTLERTRVAGRGTTYCPSCQT